MYHIMVQHFDLFTQKRLRPERMPPSLDNYDEKSDAFRQAARYAQVECDLYSEMEGTETVSFGVVIPEEDDELILLQCYALRDENDTTGYTTNVASYRVYEYPESMEDISDLDDFFAGFMD